MQESSSEEPHVPHTLALSPATLVLDEFQHQQMTNLKKKIVINEYIRGAMEVAQIKNKVKEK